MIVIKPTDWDWQFYNFILYF